KIMKYFFFLLVFLFGLIPQQSFACSCFLADSTIEEEILAMDRIAVMEVISISEIEQDSRQIQMPGESERLVLVKNIKNIKGVSPSTFTIQVGGGPCGMKLRIGSVITNEVIP